MAETVGLLFALDAAFSRLKAALIERTGHFYYEDKDDLLWERVRKRLRATGSKDCAAYLDLLHDPDGGSAEWSRLEAEITIGETFFFRYSEQFAALRESILPEIVGRKAGEKRLRIWSAGCATGAEAYSLAILVRELLGESLPDWRISILGTDINDAFLETARAARFGQWALRSLTPEQKALYFVPALGREQWQLRPEYRSLVRFERHNLLSLLDGTSPLQFTEFDLILCRNVLIYFHPETVNRVVEALRDTLVEAGWMLLGHAEPNPGFASLMQSLSLPGTTAYRHLPGDGSTWERGIEGQRIAPQRVAPWEPVLPTERAPSDGPRVSRATRLPALPIPAFEDGIERVVVEVRRLADGGHLEQAESRCAIGLAQRPVDPLLHFYKGVVAHAMKRNADAEKAFRDSIYLDKNFVMAHYHLGIHLIAMGRPQPGRRSIANAARIAAAMPHDRVLEEADGLTAGEFRNLARAQFATRLPGRD